MNDYPSLRVKKVPLEMPTGLMGIGVKVFRNSTITGTEEWSISSPGLKGTSRNALGRGSLEVGRNG